MQYKQFGRTGMQVSTICLGAMTFGKGNLVDINSCSRVVDEAVDHGVNFIDTAEAYGESETLLGHALSGKRDRVFLCTKAMRDHTGTGRCSRYSRRNLIASVDRSLDRLQTDTIDMYLLHVMDAESAIDETLATLDTLITAGKLRYIGVSNCFAWQVAAINERARRRGWPPFSTVQMCYNIVDRAVDFELASYATKHDVPIMAYSPLSGGLLTGKHTRGATLSADRDRVATDCGGKLLALHESDAIHDLLDELRLLAADLDVELYQLALLWALAKPHIGTAIVGGTRPEHFVGSYAIADRTLPADVVARIDQLSNAQVYRPYRFPPNANAPRYAD